MVIFDNVERLTPAPRGRANSWEERQEHLTTAYGFAG
jgi:hypothetical protein